MTSSKKVNNIHEGIKKTPSGIAGLDEITGGGLPQGRPTLICGSPGCGKTLMGLQFLVKGIVDYNEAGVIMSFEESQKDLADNVKSLGFDLNKLIADKKLRIDHVNINQSEIEETGEFDLEGLFVRLNYAIDSIGAKRVVIDTIENLFGGLTNTQLLRSEINRLFQWLKTKGVTSIITGERGEKTFTRQGLEEYVSDCVILLDFRVFEQIATRRLRIVKYRGSLHGTNEYPFLIDENGISVLPITSLKLNHGAPDEVVSLGLPALDKLFSNKGIYKGNSVLLTGTAGTAKTILASYFAIASCKRKERVLFFSFEESSEQLIRNMEGIGLNFRPYIKSGLLILHASRPTYYGLERHLIELHKLIEQYQPKSVVIDPVSSLITAGSASEVHAMLIRIMDFLKTKSITAIYTALTRKRTELNDAEEEISSLSDTWINLRNEEYAHVVTRSLFIVKSRGMGHSGQIHNFIITDKGIQFTDRKDAVSIEETDRLPVKPIISNNKKKKKHNRSYN